MNDLKRKRGRPNLTDGIKRTSDKRIVFKYEPLFLEGSLTGRFDGKLNPDTNTLKIYRYYGDIIRFAKAIQEYAFVNKIDTIITNFTF